MTTGYGQHCPVARASEVLVRSWVPLIVRDLLRGPATADHLAGGLPGMSASLLKTRLRHLERAGVVDSRPAGDGPVYRLSRAGHDLGPLLAQLDRWGRRWLPPPAGRIHPEPLLREICREVDTAVLPARPTAVHIKFVETPPPARWWITLGRGSAAVHRAPPGVPVGVRIDCTLGALSDIWLGHRGWREVLGEHSVRLTGTRDAVRDAVRWLGLTRRTGDPDRGRPAGTPPP